MTPNVLSIAGSDPSGGAGIQADIKTISANGAYAMAVLTSLTVQNTHGVRNIHLVPTSFVEEQLAAVIDDVEIASVKIGMIGTAATGKAIASTLKRIRQAAIVLDPVMISRSGARLLPEDAVETLRSELLPKATVLTPNLPEAAALLGSRSAKTREEIATQGKALCALGPTAVLIKGGHLTWDQSPDCLVINDEITWLENERIKTKNTHGTGCTLSSALAARLAQGSSIKHSALKAKSYVFTAIRCADQLAVGSGHGPTNHFANYTLPHERHES